MRLVMPSFLHLALAPDLDYDGEGNLQAQECGGKEIRILSIFCSCTPRDRRAIFGITT